MGNYNSINKLSFYDMQNIVNSNTNSINSNYIIINTMEINEQDCLILNTLTAQREIDLFENNLDKIIGKNIVIYGKNSNCDKVFDKYNQIKKMGFTNVYLYIGGLFEWLLLQDIFGCEEFPTTSEVIDFLKYKPNNIINKFLLLQ